MTLKSLPWLAANIPGYLRFLRALGRPEDVQRSLLQHHLQANADTAFGRAHGFASIRTAEQYRERVPLLAGEELAPWVDRIAAGEAGVLTRSPVRTLEPTSGSSAAAKLIPYTPALQREIRRAVAPWIVDLYGSHPRLALGTAYWSITPLALNEERPAGPVRIGFEEDSEYLGGFWSRLADATLAVPGSVRHLRDPDAFRYATLKFLLLRRDLSLISVWHPSFLLLLLEALPRFWDALVQDIGRSELKRLSPDVPTRIWPRLGLISCWGDAHAALSLPELARTFPGVEIQPKGLLATEGFVTIPFRGAWPLAIRSHFFEFLPEDGGSPRFAWELEEGQVCSVVLTTGGGLYRYRLQDRVRVEGFLESTPSLRFLGKEGHVSDLCGEKLHESFVAGVLARVFEGIAPRFAMLAPDHDSGYVLFLESETPPPAGLAESLDAELSANPYYRLCRTLGQLAAVRIKTLEPGAFARYLHRCRERGQRWGDVKPLALSPLMGWEKALAP
ncbi:MAG TPA: GH3 auxin-responsive promoter family protein [Thermoanaerobaculia bacterium]|nr:GH3 auxin-responsive promoter family protein [Thermoanaerobaculia bacterium]